MIDKVWTVLSVDDDREKQSELERVLSSRMPGNKFDFIKTNSFDDGIQQIKSKRFDLVFLDVHEETDPDPMNNPEAEDQRGEELLSVIKETRFVPVIFYTGYPAKVKHLENPFVKVIDKGAPIQDIRDIVNFVLSTGLLELSKHIEEQTRSYMWESLGNVFSEKDYKLKAKDISLLLARNLSNNLSQEVIKDILKEERGVINPLEMYRFPPDKDSCNPADILMKNDGSLWMVLTPACDFEQEKVDNVLMVKIVPLEEHPIFKSWQDQHEIYNNLNDDEKKIKVNKSPLNKSMDDVRRLVKGTFGDRFRFLPGTFFIPNLILDFQNTVSQPFDKKGEFTTVCSLDNPYREEMLHLFSKYFGRIGTPDYDQEMLWGEISAKHQLFKV